MKSAKEYGERTTAVLRTMFKNWPNSTYIISIWFFFFLLARNWPVFLLMDMRDGFIVKTTMAPYGSRLADLGHYFREFVLQPWNGHFIPIWFLMFFCIAYFFDSNPWITGLLSFGFAAVLLGLIYKICSHFFQGNRNGRLYALIVSLAFSSTGFFLEVLAWKWMLCLIMSSVFFCAALLMLLERKDFERKHLILYAGLLCASMWTFGTAWVQVGCLALFLLLRGEKWKKRLVLLTLAIALIGMALALATNKESAPALNPIFLLSNIPSILAFAAANVLLLTVGLFRFAAIEHMYISSVLGVTLIVAFFAHYAVRFKRKKLSEKDALVISLIAAYSVIIALSVFRLMPSEGIVPTSSPQNYVIGNRYLFIYSVPLVLAAAIALGGRIVRLPRYVLYIFTAGLLIYGIVIQATYSHVDPDISNKNRKAFYDVTPKALDVSRAKHFVLPNIQSDLFWQGDKMSLSDAIKIRQSSYSYQPIFKNPSEMSQRECLQLKNEPTVYYWLNLFSNDWCR